MFGQKLREVRMKRGYTQQQMADEIGLGVRSYQKYEQGVREPAFTMLVKIADVLEVSLDYLFSRDLSLLKPFDESQ